MHHPPPPAPSTGQLRWHRLVPLAALVLLVLVVARAFAADEPRRVEPTERRTPAVEVDTFGPARVQVPSGWTRTQRTGEVSTWSDAARDDSVTVASVEASAAPLAAIVAEVARAARAEDPRARTRAPLELTLGPAPRGDSAILLPMTVTGPGGSPIHVRQIWRRDTRAGRDVVATWTSTDERWDVDAEAGIPEADV